MADTITYDATYKRWKRFLAETKNIPETEIYSTDELVKDLKFTKPGLRSLTPRVNSRFADVNLGLQPADLPAQKTVGDGAKVIWDNIPPQHKA